MDLFERISEQVNDPDVNLLCQIPINTAEYEELLNYTRFRATTIQNQYIFSAEIYLSVAMVQIAIHEYAEGNYWGCFEEAIGFSLSQNKLNWLGQIFVATIKYYDLFELERLDGANNQYVENIKAHCLVPNKYLSGYFDFLFSFYDRNLYRQLSDDLESDINEMIDYMAETLSVSSDNIKLEKSDSRHSKSYRLLKATRCVIAQCSVITVCEIIEKHLRMIDSYYYDNVEPAIVDRFSEAFVQWSENKNSEINYQDKKRIRQSGEVLNRKPYFERAQNTVYLIIPEQKFREHDFNGQAFVSVSSFGHTEKVILDIYKAFGVLVSEKCYVPVNDIFTEYEIQIVSGSIKSYSIPAKRYRLFNDNWCELQRLRKGHCYLLTDKHSHVNSDQQAVYVQYLFDHWNEYSYMIQDDTVIYINNTPISIVGEFSEKPLFDCVPKEYWLLDEEGNQIQTTYRHPIISFIVNKQAVKGSFLYIDDDRFRVFDERISSFIEFPHDTENIGVSVMLNNLLPSEDGIYSITLDEPGKHRRVLCRYILIKSLRCRAEKRRFTFCETASVILSGNYDIKPRNCSSSVRGKYTVDLTDGTEQAEFTLKLSEHDFSLVVPLNVFKFGFSQQWIYKRQDYIWYSEIRNDLYVFVPGAVNTSVYLNRDERKKICGEEINKNLFKFDISEFVHVITEGSRAFNYINLCYSDNLDRRMTLCLVQRIIWVNKFNLYQENGVVYLDTEYQGDAKLCVKFFEQESGKLIAEKVVMNGINRMPKLTANGLYKIERFMVENDEFGFSEKITRLRGTIYKVGVIDYSNLYNCRAIIKGIYVNGKILNLDDEYTVRNLQFVSKNEYTGTMTSKTLVGNYRIKTVFDQVLIQFSGIDMNSCYIYVNDHQDWVPMSYDKSSRALISSENDLLYHSKEYSRFCDLYDDITVINVEIRRDR